MASFFVILVLAVGWGLGGCVSGPTGSPNSIPRLFRMGMTEEEAIRAGSDTPCKVRTQFHGNLAEAWGYEVVGVGALSRLKGSSCEHANYWVYFENHRVVGWTPER